MSAALYAIAMAALAAGAGFAVGVLYFRSLRPIAERIVAGNLSAVVLQLARIGGLALFLYLCARLSASALLGAAAGVLAGRSRVLRQAREEVA